MVEGRRRWQVQGGHGQGRPRPHPRRGPLAASGARQGGGHGQGPLGEPDVVEHPGGVLRQRPYADRRVRRVGRSAQRAALGRGRAAALAPHQLVHRHLAQRPAGRLRLHRLRVPRARGSVGCHEQERTIDGAGRGLGSHQEEAAQAGVGAHPQGAPRRRDFAQGRVDLAQERVERAPRLRFRRGPPQVAADVPGAVHRPTIPPGRVVPPVVRHGRAGAVPECLGGHQGALRANAPRGGHRQEPRDADEARGHGGPQPRRGNALDVRSQRPRGTNPGIGRGQ
mmetsp:Transcript_2456/g.7404  ORF Transcript_2456/g.7404 Transcript_2456/m.7404 type:complete len:281 (-) Transcript_2456:1487-2329(-)